MFSSIIRIEVVDSGLVGLRQNAIFDRLNGAWENIVSQRSHGKPYMRT